VVGSSAPLVPVQVDAFRIPWFFIACCRFPPSAPSQLNRDDVSFSTGPAITGAGCATKVALLQHPMKSLILAQDERWRRA
jgi:hypothetical protein